ncbi:MAG TPA: hypothetical protein DCM02_04890 [Flavobacterium sp.]|nr:hypothetical protein [Flavobacterium sp.]HAT77382.1 hypothetical protein [Flavobacterium sp.]
MNKPNKDSIDKKQDAVQEPETIYGTENNLISNNPEELHIILQKLIAQGIQDSIDGKGISHEEMMRRVKLRYPFLK